MSRGEIKRKISNALLKLERALNNEGVDPISGHTAEDIEAYLQWEIPIEYDSVVDMGIRQVFAQSRAG